MSGVWQRLRASRKAHPGRRARPANSASSFRARAASRSISSSIGASRAWISSGRRAHLLERQRLREQPDLVAVSRIQPLPQPFLLASPAAEPVLSRPLRPALLRLR
ncbi:MAG: hypothetical protein ABSF92_10370 [Candidatus Acidiferrales bacterium]